MAKKIRWNDGWSFYKGTLSEQNWEEVKEREFTPVDVPHDWMISDTSDLYENSTGWYRKSFFITTFTGKMAVRFDGVYMDVTVYVNEKEVGVWKYGYSTFEFDITSYLVCGSNEIVVRCVYQNPNTRWYSGAGIYRNVWLKQYPDTHIAADGIYITPIAQEKEDLSKPWVVEVDTELCAGTLAVDKLGQAIYGLSGELVAEDIHQITKEEMAEGLVGQSLQITNPVLWGIESGNLYTLVTTLYAKDGAVETETQRFGLRTMDFDSNQGFLLNGSKVKINGVCEHHDLGCLGAAFNKKAMERKFHVLRSMGVNAVRTSHNMPAPELMELADEMGFLIDCEAFDMWERPKTTYDYARFFPEWMPKDVASWVRRDRNHACLMMWSIGNEIYDTHADERGQEVTRWLQAEVLKHDPKHHAPVTIGSNFMQWENAQKCADIIKIAGYNYAERLYDGHHKAHPDWVIYGSETASVLSSRGIYHFPLEAQILTDEDEQCSALGNCTTSWGAKSCEAFLTADRDAEYSMGQFLWTGFDYIGEPTPYQTKNSYFGQIDTAGFPKDAYYICQSQWTDYKKAPMVHVFPYWDFNPGQIVDVRICSNAPRVELFVNGESKGDFSIDHAQGKELLGHWKVPFVPGEIKAVAYDETGAVIAEETRHSFKDAVAICIQPDKTVMAADGTDLIFAEISVVDEQGYPVENAKNRVTVEVSGAGRLVGLDNGDSTDFDQYQGISRRLFSGKLLAVIASKKEAGDVTIRVSGIGLEACEQTYQSIEAETEAGICASLVCTERETVAGGIQGGPVAKDELVVRKIEMSCLEETVLTPEHPQISIAVTLYPKGVKDQVTWRVTNAVGIECGLATVEETKQGAVITAVGDGEFYVRCSVKNKGTIASVQSMLACKAEGFGAATRTAYEEVCCGLYAKQSFGIQAGHENGLMFEGRKRCVAVFEGIDFGSFGSDTITLPIFSQDSDPITVNVWEGIAGEPGSVLVGELSYHKQSIWMVYQAETYTLSKRLRGIQTISFETSDRFHLRGFAFLAYDKAYQTLQAVECDRMYGDTYDKKEDAVYRIGNNVSLEYTEMDFGTEGANRVVICGKSSLEQNSIHIRRTTETGEEVIELAEFKQSDDWSEQVFEISAVPGMCQVSFVFLPGCQFDFKAFRFYRS